MSLEVPLNNISYPENTQNNTNYNNNNTTIYASPEHSMDPKI
jgi:hypothetical protein